MLVFTGLMSFEHIMGDSVSDANAEITITPAIVMASSTNSRPDVAADEKERQKYRDQHRRGRHDGEEHLARAALGREQRRLA